MSEFRVLKKGRRPLASVFKTVYLIGFGILCWSLLNSLIPDEDFLTHFSEAEDIDEIRSSITLLFTLFTAVVIAHHIRLYLTVELLEDPLSDLHKQAIGRRNGLVRFAEQFVRFAVVAFVTLKFWDIEGGTSYLNWQMSAFVWGHIDSIIATSNGPMFAAAISDGNAVREMAKYLIYILDIFILLFIWDAVVFWTSRKTWGGLSNAFATVRTEGFAVFKRIGALREAPGRTAFKEWLARQDTFWLFSSHVAGYFACLAAVGVLADLSAHGAPSSVSELLTLHWSLIALTLVYAGTLVLDVVLNFGSYREAFFGIFTNFFAPNYGEECDGSCLQAAQLQQAAAPIAAGGTQAGGGDPQNANQPEQGQPS